MINLSSSRSKVNSFLHISLILIVLIIFLVLHVFIEWNSYYDYMIWLYAISYLFIAVCFFLITNKKGIDVFSPLFGLTVLVFLYSIASGLYVDAFGETDHGFSVDGKIKYLYYLSCLVGLVGLLCGGLISNATLSDYYCYPKKHLVDNDRLFKILVFCALVFGGVFLPFLIKGFDFTGVESYASSVLEKKQAFRGDTSSGLLEIFTQYIPTFFILSLSILVFFRHNSGWFIKLLAAVVFLSYVVTQALLGSGSAVVNVLLMLVIYYHYRIRKIRLFWAIGGGFLLYVLINMMSIMRISSDPEIMYLALHANVMEQGLAFLQIQNARELLTGTIFFNLIEGLESGQVDYLYFSAFFNELATYFPRGLYPDRPLPLSEEYARVFHSDLYHSGGGAGFFFFMEGYWAFGVMGVFVYMFLFGFGVQTIYKRFRFYMNNDCMVFIYGGIYTAVVLVAVRSGVVGIFKTALMNILPLIIIVTILVVSKSIKKCELF